jgi:hypothetical protein
MDKFKNGDKVRQIGKSQVMTVVGKAGLGAVSTAPGRAPTLQGRAMCSWSNAKGRPMQKSFPEADLELAN